MVCVQNVRQDSRILTAFLRKDERIQTAKGSLLSIEWLQNERDRMARSNIACEIVESPGGRVALRKKQFAAAD